MTNVTLLDKARHGRVNAIASLNAGRVRADTALSIFDSAFDTARNTNAAPARTNVIEFRSRRTESAAPHRLAA